MNARMVPDNDESAEGLLWLLEREGPFADAADHERIASDILGAPLLPICLILSRSIGGLWFQQILQLQSKIGPVADHRLRVTKSSRITLVTFPSNAMVSLLSSMRLTSPSPNMG